MPDAAAIDPNDSHSVTLSQEQLERLINSSAGSTDIRSGIVAGTFNLLRGQPFPNLVALIFIIGFFALAIWVVGWGAPAFQANTHSLVRELDDKHEARSKEADVRWAAVVESVGTRFDKAEAKRDEIQQRQWAKQAEDGKVLMDIREILKDRTSK